MKEIIVMAHIQPHTVGEDAMKRIRVIALMLAIGGSMVLGGCDEGENNDNALLLLLASSSSNQGTISFYRDGTHVTLKSQIGFIWDDADNQYIASFGKDILNSIFIMLPCSNPMTAPQTFDETTVNFEFDYILNLVAYYPGGSGFELTIDSVADGKASGTFSGDLVTAVSGVPPVIQITEGTFTGVVIH